MKKIAVIGGGWYGCHIARALKLRGYDVTLFESANDIFKGISGKFGIRLHVGPHYPRSEKTRKSCREGYAEFIKTYPELVVGHVYSTYGLGIRDVNNEPPKIDLKTFREVGKEVVSKEIDPKKWGYNNLQSGLNVEEPSILIGDDLREKFKTYLSSAGVKIACNFKINKLVRWEDAKTMVMGEGDTCFGVFDYVVNTTSYQALLPPPKSSLPFNLNIIYQPCLALIYEDRLSKVISLPPFSFIVIDGLFPCIMPYLTRTEEAEDAYRKYIVTHGKFTIMGSYETVQEAKACLAKIDEKFISTHVRPICETEMERFWPPFGALMPASAGRRFKCVSWQGTVLAKIKTNREFRSAVTFARDGVVYVIPGKVSNVFDAERETVSLINNQNVSHQEAYQYVKNGVLDDAVNEITEPLDPKIRNACTLQTYAEITNRLNEKKDERPEPIRSAFSKLDPPIKWLSRKSLIRASQLERSSSASIFPLSSKSQKAGYVAEASGYKTKIRSSL